MSEELDARQLIARGRAVLEAEAQAITSMVDRLGEEFIAACRLIHDCSKHRGRVVVTGMGKSGHVGNKIAATLASTGSPSFFLHPAEASHGDIGMITTGDVVLALSNSGESNEIVMILPALKRLETPLIAMTGRRDSSLGRAADVVLDTSVAAEACPLNLAPTTSTTVALALGDALAVAVLEARGFTEEDFARSHPGGSLGRRLLLHVSDVMRRGERLPKVRADVSLRDALAEMSRGALGFTTIVDEQDRLLGVFTDGDLRRLLDRPRDINAIRISEVMKTSPHTAHPRMLAAEAVHIMESRKITALPVVDESNVLVGALNVHDLFQAGVM
jgi:arabinose-5-phosphate isomerase